jgi:hypothetical protein
MNTEELKAALEKRLADKDYIFRVDPLRKMLDGFSVGVMANFDSAGDGVPGAFQIGRKVAYPTPSYILWVLSRFTARTARKE